MFTTEREKKDPCYAAAAALAPPRRRPRRRRRNLLGTVVVVVGRGRLRLRNMSFYGVPVHGTASAVTATNPLTSSGPPVPARRPAAAAAAGRAPKAAPPPVPVRPGRGQMPPAPTPEAKVLDAADVADHQQRLLEYAHTSLRLSGRLHAGSSGGGRQDRASTNSSEAGAPPQWLLDEIAASDGADIRTGGGGGGGGGGSAAAQATRARPVSIHTRRLQALDKMRMGQRHHAGEAAHEEELVLAATTPNNTNNNHNNNKTEHQQKKTAAHRLQTLKAMRNHRRAYSHTPTTLTAITAAAAAPSPELGEATPTPPPRGAGISVQADNPLPVRRASFKARFDARYADETPKSSNTGTADAAAAAPAAPASPAAHRRRHHHRRESSIAKLGNWMKHKMRPRRATTAFEHHPVLMRNNTPRTLPPPGQPDAQVVVDGKSGVAYIEKSAPEQSMSNPFAAVTGNRSSLDAAAQALAAAGIPRDVRWPQVVQVVHANLRDPEGLGMVLVESQRGFVCVKSIDADGQLGRVGLRAEDLLLAVGPQPVAFHFRLGDVVQFLRQKQAGVGFGAAGGGASIRVGDGGGAAAGGGRCAQEDVQALVFGRATTQREYSRFLTPKDGRIHVRGRRVSAAGY